MSMNTANAMGYQWSAQCEAFCKQTCPHAKDWQHCVGLCQEAATLAIDEARAGIKRAVTVMSGEPVESAPSVPASIAATPGHRLRVFEVKDGVATEIGSYPPPEYKVRDQFLAEWSAIGEGWIRTNEQGERNGG